MDNQARILIVGNFLSKKVGLRTTCEDFARLLIKSGWSVIQTSRKASRISRVLDMVVTTWKYRTDYDFACIDTYSGLAFIWAELVCYALRIFKKPVILILHGGNLPQFAKRWPKRVKRLMDNASVVTSPSGYLQSKLHSYREDIIMIPNPLEINQYPYHAREDVNPCLIWMRAFHHIYNPELAPQVIASLIPSFPEIRLFMIGPDKGDGSLQSTQQIVKDLDITNHCIFPGPIPKNEVPNWLNNGDIFINTTNIDNTPVSLLEAMACGLCVVSTNVGGIPYLLEDKQDALLVAPNDFQAMSDAIKQILTYHNLAYQLSVAGRKKAEGFDWKKVLPLWEEVFRSL